MWRWLANPRPAGAPKAAAAADTAEQVAEVKGKGPRKLVRRDTDEALDRAIATHFRGTPRSEWETKQVDGKRLRQRVSEDLKAMRGHGKGKRLGTHYWRGLRSQYIDLQGLDGLKIDKELPTSSALNGLLRSSPRRMRRKGAQSLLKLSSSHVRA